MATKKKTTASKTKTPARKKGRLSSGFAESMKVSAQAKKSAISEEEQEIVRKRAKRTTQTVPYSRGENYIRAKRYGAPRQVVTYPVSAQITVEEQKILGEWRNELVSMGFQGRIIGNSALLRTAIRMSELDDDFIRTLCETNEAPLPEHLQ